MRIDKSRSRLKNWKILDMIVRRTYQLEFVPDTYRVQCTWMSHTVTAHTFAYAHASPRAIRARVRAHLLSFSLALGRGRWYLLLAARQKETKKRCNSRAIRATQRRQRIEQRARWKIKIQSFRPVLHRADEDNGIPRHFLPVHRIFSRVNIRAFYPYSLLRICARYVSNHSITCCTPNVTGANEVKRYLSFAEALISICFFFCLFFVWLQSLNAN